MKCEQNYCALWNRCPNGRQFQGYHPDHPETKCFPLPDCYVWPSWGKEMADDALKASSRGWSDD